MSAIVRAVQLTTRTAVMTESVWASEFGRYQWKQYILLLIPAYTGGINTLSQVILGATPKHRCLAVNDTIVDYVGSCAYISARNETLPCEAYEYDQTDYSSTVVTDWDLVCDRRWMGSVVQSIYMLGLLIAAIILGPMADRFGRRKVLIPSGVFQLAFSVGCGFVNNYAVYAALRFLIAFSSAGAYMIGFVLALELIPDRYRTMAGFVYQLVFALGIAAVAGWSYWLRDWPLLQIVFGLHSTFLLLHAWLVDESPRWLYSQGQHDAAGAIVCKQLVANGKAVADEGSVIITPEQLRASLTSPVDGTCSSSPPPPPPPPSPSPCQPEEKTKEKATSNKYGIRHLFKTPRLRWRTFNISLNWFANSLVYYGLSLNTGALIGEPHLMLFISGIIEVPAYLISAGIIDRLGRRPVISFCLLTGGIACIATTYFPQNSFAWTTSTTTVVMLAKCFISVSFALIYNYTVELFPTVVRSSAVGIGSTSARISGVLTPLIFLMDSLDPKLPSVLFGIVALLAGFFSLYLPETKNSPLLNSVEDGEEFGVGDTFFARFFRRGGGGDQRSSSTHLVVLSSSTNPLT